MILFTRRKRRDFEFEITDTVRKLYNGAHCTGVNQSEGDRDTTDLDGHYKLDSLTGGRFSSGPVTIGRAPLCINTSSNTRKEQGWFVEM
jgi:hypothetical protein